MDGNEFHLKIPSIVWIPLIICVVLLFVVDIFQIQTYSISTPPFRSEDYHEDAKSLKGFLIKTPGCRIPYMDPFDKSVVRFIEKEKKPNCLNGKPPLYESNDTSLFLLPASLVAYNVDNFTSLNCCYTPFWRKTPKNKETDNKVEYAKGCISLDETADISDEFIRVTCNSATNESLYKDYFAFVPLKVSNTTKQGENSKSNETSLNILVFGLDAVSRVNFHRQMPKTAAYLRNISAIEMLGYNKVGDNTFPNLIPALTGYSENELRNICWPEKSDHFDKCPFIWKMYKRKGYLTSFGEDSVWMGIFNYVKRGFQQQPTDYMVGAFNREAESKIGNQHKVNVHQCVGARQVFKNFMNYITKFVTKMHSAKQKYFGFYWLASLGHDILNMPKIGDDFYKQFFKSLKESGKLNNTVLFFMSDHGIRWGGIRQTYQGRMEERLPFLYLILPDWFKDKYQESYRNLQRNVRRLTTPFDLHETLVDLLDFRRENLSRPNKEVKRGYSLFSKISLERTCEEANISSHWCACQQSFEVAKNSTVVIEASKAVVDHMNSLLVGYAQCANLTLKTILDTRLMSHGEHMLNGKANFKDYTVTVQTEPGDGVFESTVRQHLAKNKTHNSTHFEIMGTISRLNLYGTQSSCVMDFHLKLYCYCRSLLSVLSF